MLNQQACVNRLIINALLAVLFDDVQEVIFIEFLDRAMHTFQGLIHRHRADGNGLGANNRRPDLIQIHATGG